METTSIFFIFEIETDSGKSELERLIGGELVIHSGHAITRRPKNLSQIPSYGKDRQDALANLRRAIHFDFEVVGGFEVSRNEFIQFIPKLPKNLEKYKQHLVKVISAL